MAKQVKQWLAVLNEILHTDENSNRYCALLTWGVNHYGLSFSINGIMNNGEILYIATLEAQDSEENFKDFCTMAKAVDGLYDIDNIFDTSIKILKEKANK